MQQLERMLIGLVLIGIIVVGASPKPVEANPNPGAVSTMAASATRTAVSSAANAVAALQVGWIDWGRWRDWIWHWVQIAEDRVSRVRNPAARSILKWHLDWAKTSPFDWALGEAITRSLRNKGAYVPNKPWWLYPVPDTAWTILTAAENAGG